MSSKNIDLSSFTDNELCLLERAVKDEKDRRRKEQFEKLQNDAMVKILKVWPNVEQESGKIVVQRFEKTKSSSEFIFLITPIQKIHDADNLSRSPPYLVSVKSHTFKGITKYEMGIDLNCAKECGSSSGMNFFNFASPEGNNAEKMGSHWQFTNNRELPKDFGNIPIIKDLLTNYYDVFVQLFE